MNLPVRTPERLLTTFVDGQDYEEIFETPLGPIGVFAEAHIFGLHLVLEGLLVYATGTSGRLPIGVNQTLAIVRHLRVRARDQGFVEMTVVFHRTGEGRHGRIITQTRRLE